MNMHPLSRYTALALLGASATALAADVKSPPPAHEVNNQAVTQFVEQYDGNGDGKVDLAEFARFREARYAETDSNKDGSVDVDEYVIEYAGRFDRELEAARKAQVEQTRTRFRSVDKDGDGFISRAEFDASGDRAFTHIDTDKDGRIGSADPEPMRESRPAASGDAVGKTPAASARRDVLKMPSTHTRAGMLELYDVDGDGVVTRQEFDRLRGDAFKLTDANGDGRIDADEYLAEFENRLDRQIEKVREASSKQSVVRFKALDADEDGRISPVEYAASGKRMFDRLDTDKDSVVSAEDPPAAPRETRPSPDSKDAAERAAAWGG